MSAFSKTRLAVSAAVLAAWVSVPQTALAQTTPAEVGAACAGSPGACPAIVRAAILANRAAADEIVAAALAAAPDQAAAIEVAAADALEGTAGGGGGGGGGVDGEASDFSDGGAFPNFASPS